jgi:hypothetical protein
LRLYRMTHRLAPGACNLHAPDVRELLAESEPLE